MTLRKYAFVFLSVSTLSKHEISCKILAEEVMDSIVILVQLVESRVSGNILAVNWSRVRSTALQEKESRSHKCWMHITNIIKWKRENVFYAHMHLSPRSKRFHVAVNSARKRNMVMHEDDDAMPGAWSILQGSIAYYNILRVCIVVIKEKRSWCWGNLCWWRLLLSALCGRLLTVFDVGKSMAWK